MSESAITDQQNDIASRIARKALAKRDAAYVNEVRRLLDAGLRVMRDLGTSGHPRVADIVAAAGLSNDAFYRHFRSKDALVAAILEDGTQRLHSYVAHQMTKESTAAGKVRRWVEGILAQAADEEVAATTLAVLWNSSSLGEDHAAAPPSPTGPLAELLHGPFADLGSAAPELDAALVAHATIGILTGYLWKRIRPTSAEIDQVTSFCLRAARPDAPAAPEAVSTGAVDQ